jgi:flagellar basal-body rod protein FlgC
MKAMEISLTALDVEWQRLEVIAENLANAGTAGTGWQPRRLVSGPQSSFADRLDPVPASSEKHVPSGVAVRRIETLDVAPRLVHEPGNPAADASGNIAYPGVSQASEMALLVKTARIYEANIVAMGSARQMYAKALELGRRS